MPRGFCFSISRLCADLSARRCRTCRKRKTRCDGQRPLCLTCTENGHECLGYALDGGEVKREGKGATDGRERNDETFEDQVKSAGIGPRNSVQYQGEGFGRFHGSHGPFKLAPKMQENFQDRKQQGHTSHRDIAVFSDEEASPMGRISLCPVTKRS
jgi:hypothetical protein